MLNFSFLCHPIYHFSKNDFQKETVMVYNRFYNPLIDLESMCLLPSHLTMFVNLFGDPL